MADIIVSNQAELVAALQKARGGETIKLAAGSYGVIKLDSINPGTNVTIVSADPANPARLDQIQIKSSSNLTFKGLDIGLPVGTPEPGGALAAVNTSSNIKFDDVHFFGPKANAAESSMTGLSGFDSTNISVTNSSFDHLMGAVAFSRTTGIVVKNNSMSEIRRDGMIFAEVSDVLIDGNQVTAMHPATGDHPDGIQFYTNGTKKASTNITISNNVIVQGAGEGSQGIFMGDELNGALPYQNVKIVNNLVYMTGLSQGITVASANNVVVSSNTVLSRSDDNAATWIMLSNVKGGALSNNVADKLITTNTTAVTMTGNSWLDQSGATLRALGNINGMASAKLSDFIIDRVGFHPARGTVAYDLWMAERQAETKLSLSGSSSDHMVLDLQFTSTGVVDRSRFDSQATLDATNLETVNGKNVYHVATSKGFELARSTSWQVYGMSAFTFSFTMQRDSTSTGTGQVLGIYQSWAVTLQSNGEINFTMRNDAGVTYSVVTSGAKIQDLNAHNIAITYDKAAKKAVIYVDNVARGSGTVTGSTRALEYWSLYVGSPYGTSLAGKVSNIQIRDVALAASQISLTSGGQTVVGDPGPVLGQNPFLSTPLVAGSISSATTAQRYTLDFAHA